MAYKMAVPLGYQFEDANGAPLVGGTIEFYITGTSTATPIYFDSAGSASATSVTLNALGQPQTSGGTAAALFFDDSVTYKLVRKDALGSTIEPTFDPFNVVNSAGGQLVVDSVATLYGGDYSTFSYAETQAYTAGGSVGGAKWYKSGTGGTPTTAGTLLTDLGAGYVVDTAGNIWSMIFPMNIIDVQCFGYVVNTTTDMSSNLDAALTYAATVVGANGAGNGAVVRLPIGHAYVNNVTWPLHVTIEGAETRLTTLFFNGSEASGSCVLDCPTGQSFAHLKNLSLFGYIPSGSALAENLIKDSSSATWDLNQAFYSVAFKGAKYNAIDIVGQVVNTHMRRVRFDGIGGYGVAITTRVGMESRPVSIEDFTLDNNNSALPSTYSAHTEWGLGLLRFRDGGHNTRVSTISLKNARIEKNVEYKNTDWGDYTSATDPTASVVLEGNATAGAGQYNVTCDNVIVTGSSNIISGEGLVAGTGYTSSSLASGTLRSCAMASPNGQLWVDNVSSGRNVPATAVLRMFGFAQPETSAVRVRLSTDQTGIASGSYQQINFDSESLDVLGEYDSTTNYRFTPTTAGWYRIRANVRLDAGVSGTRLQVTILKNGTTRTEGDETHMSSTSPVAGSVEDWIQFNGTTDYVTVEILHNTGANRTARVAGTYFTAELIK